MAAAVTVAPTSIHDEREVLARVEAQALAAAEWVVGVDYARLSMHAARPGYRAARKKDVTFGKRGAAIGAKRERIVVATVC